MGVFPSVDNVFPGLCVSVDTEQPPRRVLASRPLLLAAVGVPRFDPRPDRKRGQGSKRGEEGSRWSLLARWRRLVWVL
jgi:hypothetical protein